MRKNAQHEGGHGTYTNKEIDETSTGKLGQTNRNKPESNLVVDDSLKEKIKEGTDAYNKAVENGDIRNKSITELITGGIQKRESYKTTEKEYTRNGKLDIELIKSDWNIDDKGANNKANAYNNKDNFVAAVESTGEVVIVSLIFSPGVGLGEGITSIVLKTAISNNSVPTREEQYLIAVAMIKEERKQEAERFNNAMKAIIYTDQLIDAKGNISKGNLAEYNKAMEKSGNKI